MPSLGDLFSKPNQWNDYTKTTYRPDGRTKDQRDRDDQSGVWSSDEYESAEREYDAAEGELDDGSDCRCESGFRSELLFGVFA